MKKIIIALSLAVSAALYAADQAALSSANPVDRANAAQSIGRDKDASGVDALAKMLSDSEANVAYAAAQALAEIGNDKAAETLLAALKAGKDAVAGDAALACAGARCGANDLKQSQALLEACYASKNQSVKYTALTILAALEPVKYASAIEAALTSGDLQQSIAAVNAVMASKDLVPVAVKALAATQAEAKARIIGALASHVAQAQVKPILVAALSDESEAVRIAGLHAAVVSNNPDTFAPMFAACSKDGEEARVAMLMFASSSSKAVDAFLYEQMKQGASRCKAIEILASRHQKELIGRLCDASLYAEKGVNQAAAGAFRVCLQAPDLAKAITFVFSVLPADQRAPLVSALSSVVQQLPGTERVAQEISAQFATMKPEARADALDVLAALQTPEICKLLVDQSKTGDAEYRKAIVRNLAKWNQPVALDALVELAKGDADRAVKILATRNVLSMLDKKGMADAAKKVAVLQALASVAERDDEKRLIHTALKGLGGKEAEALRKELASTLKIDDAETAVLAINLGGPAVGHFKADADFEGGKPFSVKAAIDLSEAQNAAPEEVYQTSRFGDCTYRLSGLTPNGAYKIRLHYAELFHKAPGGRAGDVIVNGVKIIDNLPSGDHCKAFTVTKDITANAEGKVIVEIKTTRDHVKVNGLEILAIGAAAKAVAPVSPAPVAPVAQAAPGQIRVLLLTGANNHNWQETTASLKKVYATNPKFFVTVNESPWDMTPDSLTSCDVVFFNWNTFGKDKREWSQAMKDAFIPWVKKGGNVVIFHAGGSIFYNWPEFMSLIGGTWEKGTFHPAQQEYTVKINNPDHPITKGMKDFVTFDEPWQKLSNRNPDRKVLATTTIPKEKTGKVGGGTGEPEVMAMTTELEKGRCFNLVLGHSGKSIENEGCTALILRGTEWAATGRVE
jgi:type 1 glutamine amidotransferase/HEAT repeat protein